MVTIATHHDADGISSAVLYIKSLGLDLEDVEVIIPEEFGDVEDEDVVLDMRPINCDYEGTVYDHHPDHPKERKYKLYHGDLPATGVVFNKHFKTIPKNQWWKAAVGIAGDGQPEKTPIRILKRNPELMARMSYVSESYGKTKVTSILVINTLASPVNSLCRIGEPREALELLFNAENPWDLNTPRTAETRKAVQNDIDSVFKLMGSAFPRPININGLFTICEFESDYKIGGLIAMKINEGDKSTVIAINKRTGVFSIRGVFAAYAVDILTKNGIKAGGHAAFAGGSLKDGESMYEIAKILSLPKENK